MARSRSLTLLLIPFAFLLMGARGAPLVDPQPIAVPAGLTAKDVSKAIRTGIVSRGWIVGKDEKGQSSTPRSTSASTRSSSPSFTTRSR